MTGLIAKSTAADREDTSRYRSQNAFRQDIEGLRAVAVLAVVLFHAEVPGITGGYVGVDVFFVISGFLITGLLWRQLTMTGAVRLREFYGARARRLLPASATVAVVTAIGSAILLPPLQARSVLGDGIASALYVGNYRFAIRHVDYLGAYTPPSPFQHYWSLGVEEQFYLVWPTVIIASAWLFRRARRRTGAGAATSTILYFVVLALGAAVSFVISLVATQAWPSWSFFSLPTRAWELALGGMVALTAGAWRRLTPVAAATTGWGGLALIALTCIHLNAKTPYPGTAALFPVFGAALVIGGGCAASAQGPSRILSLSPMRAIGRVSYSWYLWHWPVLLLAPALLGHPLGLAGRLTAAALSGGLAWLTLHLIENPVRFATSVRRSAVGSLALGGIATAVAACAGMVLLALVPVPVGRGAPAARLAVTVAPYPSASKDVGAYDAAVQQAFAQVNAAVSASADLEAVPSNLDPPLADASADERAMMQNDCLLHYRDVAQPTCASGDLASRTTVALVGDSHAVMWAPALQQVAAQRHWRLEAMGKFICPLQDIPIINPDLGREYSECGQWRGQIMTRLRAEHPRLIVVSARREYGPDFGVTEYDSAWLDGLGRMVAELRATGASVLVLGPVPVPHTDVPTCLSIHLGDARACALPRSKAVDDSGVAAEQAVTTANGGRYANLTPLFCTVARCPLIVGDELVYFDENHITMAYARALAPVIGTLVDRAMLGSN